MHFDFKEIATITMVLFAVIDVIGSIPIIIALRDKGSKINSIQATIVSGLIMIVFLFLGNSILDLIGIDIQSFAIAGAFILFIISIEMILGIRISKDESTSTVSVIPVAFPLIAGAGTLTTLLALRSEFIYVENIIVGILINLVVVYIVLRNTNRIEKFIGAAGINLLKKVFGVILLALAVKLFKSNA